MGYTHRRNLLSTNRAVLCLLVASSCLLLFGCTKKKAPKGDMRTVTTEVVGAAQKITSNKARVVVRPTSAHGSSAAFDDIYVSLSNSSQAAAFEDALKAIAQRHDLAVTSGWASADGHAF